ncbi:hypothetical protein KAW65_09015 [candidate division WOR-3 bacterium]|nr:hypothetical protein [candidate division WOR-3 bacterium]
MNLKYHRTLTKDKWVLFPFSKQLLMIANELNRANKWIEEKDFNEQKLCYERAFELLYLTIQSLQDTKDTRKLREILRFKEILASLYNKGIPSIEENKKLLKALVLLDKDSFSMLGNSI